MTNLNDESSIQPEILENAGPTENFNHDLLRWIV